MYMVLGNTGVPKHIITRFPPGLASHDIGNGIDTDPEERSWGPYWRYVSLIPPPTDLHRQSRTERDSMIMSLYVTTYTGE